MWEIYHSLPCPVRVSSVHPYITAATYQTPNYYSHVLPVRPTFICDVKTSDFQSSLADFTDSLHQSWGRRSSQETRAALPSVSNTLLCFLHSWSCVWVILTQFVKFTSYLAVAPALLCVQLKKTAVIWLTKCESTLGLLNWWSNQRLLQP